MLKEFIRPDLKKIIISIILLVFFLLFEYNWAFGELYVQARGLPFPILTYDSGYYFFIYFGLIGDIIFWYLISCLIIFIYNKYRGKKK